MAKVQRNSATRKVKRDASTRKALHANAGGGCCCGCPGCYGLSAATFSCALSGITLVQGCSNAGSSLDWVHVDQASLAGTFTLSHPAADPFGVLPASCVWMYGEAPGVTVSAQAYRAPGGCTGTPTGDFGFYIRLSRIDLGGGSGQWRLEAYLGNDDEVFHDLFVASLSTADCGHAASFTPNLTYHQGKGSGGTATITPP